MDIREHNRRAWDRQVEYGPFEFSHTLEEQIGGQIEAGFVITGFYEDHDDAAAPKLPPCTLHPARASVQSRLLGSRSVSAASSCWGGAAVFPALGAMQPFIAA